MIKSLPSEIKHNISSQFCNRSMKFLDSCLSINRIQKNITIRDAPITHWPIIGRPVIGAKQSADYRLIQKVPETGQKPV